jgi:hypothetical protein
MLYLVHTSGSKPLYFQPNSRSQPTSKYSNSHYTNRTQNRTNRAPSTRKLSLILNVPKAQGNTLFNTKRAQSTRKLFL